MDSKYSKEFDQMFTYYYSSLQKLNETGSVELFSDSCCKMFVALNQFFDINIRYSKTVEFNYTQRRLYLESKTKNIPTYDELKQKCWTIFQKIMKMEQREPNLYVLNGLLSREYKLFSGLIEFIFGPPERNPEHDEIFQFPFPDGASACLGMVEEDYDMLMNLFRL